MSENYERKLAAYEELGELLGIKPENPRIAIATDKESAKVKASNGSLEATVMPTVFGMVEVESPRAPGINIRLVDPTKDVLAPAGAIYEISAYISEEKSKTGLNGDVASVYVGKQGIILDKAGRQRARKLPLD